MPSSQRPYPHIYVVIESDPVICSRHNIFTFGQRSTSTSALQTNKIHSCVVLSDAVQVRAVLSAHLYVDREACKKSIYIIMPVGNVQMGSTRWQILWQSAKRAINGIDIIKTTIIEYDG